MSENTFDERQEAIPKTQTSFNMQAPTSTPNPNPSPSFQTPEKRSNKTVPVIILVVVSVLAVIFVGGALFSATKFAFNSTTTPSSSRTSSTSYSDGSSSEGLGWSANSMVSSSAATTGSSVKNSSYDEEAYVADEAAPNSSNPEPVAQTKDDERGQWLSGNQKIVYSASVVVQTTEFDKAYEDLKALIAQNNGFISKENTSRQSKTKQPETQLTVRVPAENFQSFYDNIGTAGIVVSSSSDASNITKQYSETQSRISSLEIQEQRLLELEKSAASVEVLLSIEDRLQNVREELTKARNSLSSMDTDVTYSTVDITLLDVSEKGSEPTAEQGLGERASNAATKAWDDFVDDTEDAIVAFISDWPGHLIRIVILGVVIVIIVVAIRRHNRKPALNTDTDEFLKNVEEQSSPAGNSEPDSPEDE